MNKANDIKALIEQHNWGAARVALDSIPVAKQADWHTAKGYFLKADELAPDGEAAEMLDMITDIYDFYYKDNLNP